MERKIPLLTFAGAILVSTCTALGADLHVPGEYGTIQAAIDAAGTGDRVIIAEGYYSGAGNRDLDFGGRAISVQSSDPEDWDVVAGTVIDCESSGRGFYFQSGETSSSIVAGLTIANGYADYGGGIRCVGSGPTIRNCILSDNSAEDGGGMMNESSSAVITGCIFIGNSTTFGIGGGMCNYDCAGLKITNCIFAGNSAWWGGAIADGNSSPAIVNCTFYGNSADSGGGIANFFGANPTITNCILWGDSAASGSEIYGDCVVSYSDVQGSWPGIGNIDADPLFVDGAGGDYHLQEGSPCIDAGTNSPSGGLPETDIEGIPRPLDGDADAVAVADMGSYEFAFTEPVIALSAAYFEFTAGLGGPNPGEQILSVSNIGAGTLNWQITEACGWLSVEPNSGSSSGESNEVTLSVDISGLAGGSYSCGLMVWDPCALNSPRTVDVNLILSEPIIELSAQQFQFTALEDGLNPDDQILTIWNSGQGTLNWQITEECSWLSVEPNSGSSGGEVNEVTLSVDMSGLGAGSYYCQLIVSDPCALNSPRTVDVNLIVTQPIIGLSSQQFQFTALEDGLNPDDQILTIWNSGQGTLNWLISEDGSWLSVEPNSGSSTGEANEVTLSVDISGLAGGSYNCMLLASDPNAENSPRAIDVNLVITGPIIELSATEFELFAEVNGPNPPSQMLTIHNSGGGTLNWTITEDCDWLSVEPNSGSSTGEANEVTLSVDISGLAEGNYNCELTISDPNAENSPQTVAVNLTIYLPGDVSTLVSLWLFEEGEGTTAHDSFGGNDGTVYGANWTAGMVGGALGFDGVDDYVHLGTDNSLKPPLPVSLCAWVKLSSLGSPQYIVAIDDQTGKYYGIWWYVGSAGNLAVGYGDGGPRLAGSRRSKVGTTALNTDTWYHIAAVLNGPTDMSLYVNGIDDGGTYSGTGGSVAYSSTSSLIGMMHFYQYPFGGKIDDVRVYEGGLLVGEVWEVYQRGLSGEVPPSIHVWPKTLEFDANEGGPNPASQTVSVRNIGAGVLDWRITEDCPWLEVEPNAGTSAGESNEVTVSVDKSGLAWGAYSCELIISDANALNSPRAVDVNLIVRGPVMELSAEVFEFEAVEGGASPEDKMLGIRNSGTGRLNWQIIENCDWVSVEPNSGSSTGETNEVALSVDIFGLVGGSYSCVLTVWDPNAENSPQIIDVNLTVVGPVIEVSAAEFQFYGIEGGPNPAAKMLTMQNSGGGTLYWQISEDCDWLDVDPNTGSSRGEADQAALSLDITGLTAGDYDCVLTVSDSNAENSPQTVLVSLDMYGEGEIQVPSEYGTIQAGINAAEHGYTVVVAPGTFTGAGNRDLDFWGKGITVRSIDPYDPCVVAATVIDCNGSSSEPHRGFYFHSGEGPNSVVAGFTIKNGYVYGYDANGGGISCMGASPRIENCIITNNTARGRSDTWSNVEPSDGYGGGVFCTAGSNPAIVGCTISNNTARGGNANLSFDGSNGYGGGICCEANGNAAVTDCEISNNRAVGGVGRDGSLSYDTAPGGDSYGAGIHIGSGSDAIIENCNVSGNSASGGRGGGEHWRSGARGGGAYGAGIYCGPDGTVDIKKCIIKSNNGSGGDGGRTDGYDPLSWGGSGGRCYGGGLFCSGEEGSSIKNCIVLGNTALGGDGGYGGYEGGGGDGGNAYGGGMYSGNSTTENCTITGNTLLGGSGGSGSPVGSDGVTYGWGIYCDGGNQTINNCILWDNDGNDVDGSGYTVTYSCTEQIVSGTGNIHDLPLFVSGPEGDYYLSQVAAGQAVDSPCVDAGSNWAAKLGMNICSTRTDGVNDVGIVDMGYHYGDCNCGLNVADIDGDLDVDFVDYALFAADYAENSMTIPRGSVVVDGNLDDWAGDVEWVALDKIYYGSPNDVGEAWFALRWDGDANKVYAAVILYDSDHVFLDEYTSWDASDRLEVYSQGDAEGGSGWLGVYDVAQQYYVAPNTVGGSWGCWPGGVEPNEDVGFEYAVRVDGEQIIYEIGVKQFDNYGGFSGGDTIVTALEVGDVVGFDLVVDTRWSDGFGMLSENLMTGKFNNADKFARYMLAEEVGGPPCFERVGDFDGNCAVNFADLAILVDSWLWGK